MKLRRVIVSIFRFRFSSTANGHPHPLGSTCLKLPRGVAGALLFTF